METKLTLSLDNEVIKKAKLYAKKKHTSLSNMVENYFYFLTAEEYDKETSIISETPITNQLLGSVRIDIDPEKLKEDYLLGKYLSA